MISFGVGFPNSSVLSALRRLFGATVVLCLLVSCVSGPVYPDRPPELSVLTFNIWYDYENQWEQRKEVLHEYLVRTDPDIMGLQEVVSAVPEYFLDRNRPLEWLSHTPDIAWSNHWGHIVPTSVTWAKIESTRSGHTFVAKNTHLGVLRPRGRRRSVELIYSRTPNDIPVVIMGDFNETPNRFVPRYLRNRGFTDAHEGMGGSLRVFANREFAPHRLDYIMVRGLQVADRRIDSPRRGSLFVSDHNALIAYLVFGYPPPTGPAPTGPAPPGPAPPGRP